MKAPSRSESSHRGRKRRKSAILWILLIRKLLKMKNTAVKREKG
jgi:hypothetical protein